LINHFRPEQKINFGTSTPESTIRKEEGHPYPEPLTFFFIPPKTKKPAETKNCTPRSQANSSPRHSKHPFSQSSENQKINTRLPKPETCQTFSQKPTRTLNHPKQPSLKKSIKNLGAKSKEFTTQKNRLSSKDIKSDDEKDTFGLGLLHSGYCHPIKSDEFSLCKTFLKPGYYSDSLTKIR
jgi:hypothetical protein